METMMNLKTAAVFINLCILSVLRITLVGGIVIQEAIPVEEERNLTYKRFDNGDRDKRDLEFCPQYQHLKLPKDCAEIRDKCTGELRSGEFYIQPKHYPEPFLVYCDHETDGGGWTVIQRRVDGSIDFNRYWADYKNGFGFPQSEFWLGNEKIFYIANQKNYQLRIDLVNREGNSYYAKYTSFRIGEERLHYKLLFGTYAGNAGADSLDYHRGMSFSTQDADHDRSETGNCASSHGGAWWFKECDHSNLNGVYGEEADAGGMEWTGLPGGSTLFKRSEMKIR